MLPCQCSAAQAMGVTLVVALNGCARSVMSTTVSADISRTPNPATTGILSRHSVLTTSGSVESHGNWHGDVAITTGAGRIRRRGLTKSSAYAQVLITLSMIAVLGISG